MKKIGICISQMNGGGAERAASRLTTILKNDYEVYLIVFEKTYMAYPHEGKLYDMGIPAGKGLLSRLLLPFRRARKLKKIKKELGLGCVISFLDSPNVVNILSKTKRCKVLVSIRSYSQSENKWNSTGRIMNQAIKLLYNRADGVIPVSRMIAYSYEKDYGVAKEKLFPIYNAYDLDEIAQKCKEPTQAVDFSGMQSDIKFVTMGRQMYAKGYWHLLKAFQEVHKHQPNTKLIMLGADYGQERKILWLIQALELQDSVLLTGRQENPFSVLAGCDIYVLSSMFEGFPNALVEAMACGLPVVSVDCKSGPREILYKETDILSSCADVEYADYGILTRPMEAQEDWTASPLTPAEQSLAKAMLEFSQNAELRKKYRELGFRRAQDFNYERCRQAYVSLIEHI